MTPSGGIQISIIIPVYNEAGRIEVTLERLVTYLWPRWSFEIIVIDDGSIDASAMVIDRCAARHPEIRRITHPANRGKGAAVQQGVLEAAGRVVAFSDADFSTPIEELEPMLARLQEGIDVVIGSRALPGSRLEVRQRWTREMMGRMFNLLVRKLFGLPFRDTQCGFKVFQREAARDIFSRVTVSGFAFDVEVLLLARRLDYRVCEVPVRWAHMPDSKVRLVRDSLGMLGEVARLARLAAAQPQILSDKQTEERLDRPAVPHVDIKETLSN